MARIAVAILVALLLFSPYLAHWEPISNENNMFRSWYATGPFSPFRPMQALAWISNVEFGVPRTGSPLYISWYPPAYLGAWLGEPLFGYLLWISAVAIGLLGGWRLFSLFTTRRELAFIAGTAFVLSGALFNSAVIGLYAEKILFTPWTLYFLLRGLRDERFDLLLMASCLHALHFVGSPSYVWFYLSAGMAIFIAGRAIRPAFNWPPDGRAVARGVLKGVWAGMAVFGPCALLLVAAILPIAEYGHYAVHRGMSDHEYFYSGRFNSKELWKIPFWFPGALAPTRQFHVFNNLSYLGWIPVFLALLWMRTTRVRNVALVCLLLIVVLLAAGSLRPVDEIVRALPAMGLVRYSAYWMTAWNLVILYLAVMAGSRLGDTIPWSRGLREALILLGLSGVALLALVIVWKARFSIELLRPVIVGTVSCLVLAIAARQPRHGGKAFAILAAISLVDTASWSVQTPLRELNSQSTIGDYLNRLRTPAENRLGDFDSPGVGRALIFQSAEGRCHRLLASAPRMEWVYPFTAYPLKRSYEIGKRLGWSEQAARCRTGIGGTAQQLLTPERLALARALNMRFYFLDNRTDDHFVAELGFRRLMTEPYSGFDLFEDPRAAPRAVFYGSVHAVETLDDALAALDGDQRALAQAVVEISHDKPPAWLTQLSAAPSKGAAATVYSVAEYSQTRVVLRGNAIRPGMVVLSDMPYPGWEVRVDGVKAAYYPANIVGRGVFVTAGPHEIVFTFEAATLGTGILFSLLGLGVVIAAGVYFAWKRGRMGAPQETMP